MNQSNTLNGALVLISAVSLVGKEGTLAVLTDDGLQPPASRDETSLYLVTEAESASAAAVEVLQPGKNIRVRAAGSGSKGDVLILAATDGADAGKVVAIGSTEGRFFSPGIAEEDFVDEQLVRCRPLPRVVGGIENPNPRAFSGAAPAETAPTDSTPYGFSYAQASSILEHVHEMRAALILAGIMAANES
jgi:hypothetical protein